MPGTVAHAAVVAAGARATAGLAGRAACVFTQPVCRRVGSRIEGPAADTGGARVVHRERALRRGGEQGAANRRVGGRLRREGHIGRVSEARRERQLDLADTGARAVDGDALLEHVIRGAAIAGRARARDRDVREVRCPAGQVERREAVRDRTGDGAYMHARRAAATAASGQECPASNHRNAFGGLGAVRGVDRDRLVGLRRHPPRARRRATRGSLPGAPADRRARPRRVAATPIAPSNRRREHGRSSRWPFAGSRRSRDGSP
jgi:hypothetical protein